jgi:hypothetical protein
MENLEDIKEWFLIPKDNKKVGVFKSLTEVQTFMTKNKKLGKFEVITEFFPINKEVTLDSFSKLKKVKK